jgi:hypothetical protein
MNLYNIIYIFHENASRIQEEEIQGRIQNFKLGGEAHLKKLRWAEGGAKKFGIFRVKNHDYCIYDLLYWVDKKKHHIMVSHLDGTDRRTIYNDYHESTNSPLVVDSNVG